MVAPMSAGVGIADFVPVAAALPTSLAYSGSTTAPLPATGMVAICQITTMAKKISSDRRPALRRSEFFGTVTASGPLDGETVDVLGGLGGIERLAHHHDRLLRRIGWRH